MSETSSPYDNLFGDEDNNWNQKEINIGGKLDDFGEDRLPEPEFSQVWDKTKNADWSIDEVIDVWEGIIEKWYWRCSHCNKENDGDIKICFGCKKNRPLNIGFYTKEIPRIVTDATEMAKATSWPDWRCSWCSRMNNFNSRVCWSCNLDQNLWWDMSSSLGGVYEDSSVPEWNHVLENAEDINPPEKKEEVYPDTDKKTYRTRLDLKETLYNYLPTWSNVRKVVWGIWMWIITLFWINEVVQRNTIHVEAAEVESMEWERIVYLKKLVPVPGKSRWTYPDDAYNVVSVRKIHHYDKVKNWTEPIEVIKYKKEKTGTKEVIKYKKEKTGTKEVNYTDTENETVRIEYETTEKKDMWNGYFKTVPVTKKKSRVVSKQVPKTRIIVVIENVPYTATVDVIENVPYTVTVDVIEDVPYIVIEQKQLYKDVPRYKIHHTYTMDSRVNSRPVSKSWAWNNPQWPSEYDLQLRDNEKIWSREEDYDICVVTWSWVKECIDIDYDEFVEIEDWWSVNVKVNGRGIIKDLSDKQ